VSSACDEVKYNWIGVDVQIIHCETEHPTWMMSVKPVDNPLKEDVYPIQSCPSFALRPHVMPRHVYCWVSGDAHHATSFAYSAFWKCDRFFPPTVLLLLPIFPADGFVTATFFCVAASTVRLQATSFAYSAFWILI